MSGVEVNGGKKRQLPSWMLGPAKTEQPEKPSRRKSEKKVSTSEIQQAPKVVKPRKISLYKSLEKGVVGISEDDALKVDSNGLVKCRTRKRKTEIERLDLEDDEVDNDDIGLVKCRTRKRKTEIERLDLENDDEVDNDDIGPRRRRTRKIVDEVGSEIQMSTTSKKRTGKASEVVVDRDECLVPSPSEEDEELTVQDLVTIAKEYVKADEANECQQPAAKGSEPTQFPVSFEFSRKDSGGLSEAIQTSQDFTVKDAGGLSEAIQTSQDFTVGVKETSTSTFTKTNQESSEYGTIISSQSRTGDSTQDMLDLFLGPLLKIPQTGEKKSEFISEDINLACDFRKQKQSEVLREIVPRTKDFNLACEFRKQKQSEVLGEVVPRTKKKSSLKDKVSMFFD